MKTKHFLTALAIPALLAACSAEDDFTLDNSQNLLGRKIINADLVFDFNSDAATRLAIGESAITLDETDKVAAALIDKVGTTNPVNGYEITTGISTNHPFTLKNGNWSTPTRLVEGNYLFYYQYNEKLGGNRDAAVPYKINKVQNAFSEQDPQTFVGSQAVKDNAMGIGYAFLGADEKTGITPDVVKVEMYPLFAFLRFNIKTDKPGLEVQQILVKPNDDKKKFRLEGTVSNTSVATAGSKAADGTAGNDTDNPANAGVLIVKGQEKYTENYADVSGTAEDYIILSLPDLAVTATAQSAYMVIPAKDYTNSDAAKAEFTVDVYTNQGVFSREVELSTSGNQNVAYAKLTMGKVQPISLNITGTLKSANKYFVGDAAQWKKVLESLPAVAADATDEAKKLNIELLGKVELSAADIALIQTTNAKNYTMKISGGELVMAESCALSDMEVEKVSVKAGVAVELNKNLTVTTLGNSGTVNINAVSGKKADGTLNTVANIDALNNFGEANVNATAGIKTVANGSADAKADNSAVKLNVKANLAVGTSFTNNAAEKAENNATVTVDKDVELKITGTGTNEGSIINNGFITADGVFTNTGAKAVIYNKAGGVISNVNEESNAKKVVNAAGANIEAEAGSSAVVYDNTGSTITYQDGADVSVTSTAKGKIAYVVASDYLVPTTTVQYNTVVVEGMSLALKTGVKDEKASLALLSSAGITGVVLKNGATVDFNMLGEADAGGSNVGEVNLIEIQGGSNKIITHKNGIKTETLNVVKGGYVLIPLNSKVAADELHNEGTINVGGTLEYTNLVTTDEGHVEGKLLGSGTITDKD